MFLNSVSPFLLLLGSDWNGEFPSNRKLGGGWEGGMHWVLIDRWLGLFFVVGTFWADWQLWLPFTLRLWLNGAVELYSIGQKMRTVFEYFLSGLLYNISHKMTRKEVKGG